MFTKCDVTFTLGALCITNLNHFNPLHILSETLCNAYSGLYPTTFDIFFLVMFLTVTWC